MTNLAYISAHALAARWDYCSQTVLRWCKDGLIPGAVKVGCGKGVGPKRWRIPLAWVAQGEHKSIEQLQVELEETIRKRKAATWEKNRKMMKR